MIGSFGVRFGGMALTFMSGVLLARTLGPEQYGIYGTVLAAAALLAVTAQFGLPQLATREIAATAVGEDRGQMRGMVAWFLRIVLVASTVTVALGLVILLLWPEADKRANMEAWLWGLATVPVTAFIALGMAILRGLHRVLASQTYEALYRPALMAAALAVVWLKFPAGLSATMGLALQAVTGLTVTLACFLHVAAILPKAAASASRMPFNRRWVASALPMTGTEIFRVIDGQYAVLLLGILASASDVGLFRVALAVTGFAGFPATLVNLVIMPHVSQLHAKDDLERLQSIASYTALLNFVCSAAMAGGILIAGEAVLAYLFGTEYSGAWLVLLLMALAYVVNGFFGSAATILNMCGAERTVAVVHAVGPMIGIALTWLLFPYFGIIAAGWALIASELVKSIWMYLAARPLIGIDVSLLSLLPRSQRVVGD